MNHRTITLAVGIGALILGFFASPYLYPRIFGYKNAEECTLDAKTRWAVAVCFDLYPSIQDKKMDSAQKGK